MDEVNINKYLSQFNPILIVPVLSAVVGAILVFVFGFKRPNEPRFQSTSSVDSLKKSKRKSNNANAVQLSKQQQNVASTKVNNGKKISNNSNSNSNNQAPSSDASTLITGKKTNAIATNEKTGNNNNNNNINKRKDDKKSEEKKSDTGSPAKKVANSKKLAKETNANANNINNKKIKTNKKSTGDNEKPADFDDDGWFTVQSKKQQKNKNDNDANSNNKGENPSPKIQTTKSNNNNNKTKATKAIENKIAEQPIVVAATNEEISAVVQSTNDIKVDEIQPNEVESSAPVAQSEPKSVVNDVVTKTIDKKPVEGKKQQEKPIPSMATIETDSAIAFDELGEWTDAKPDRKKGNKKKSRKE